MAAQRIRDWVGPRRGAGYRVASSVASTVEQAALSLVALAAYDLRADALVQTPGNASPHIVDFGLHSLEHGPDDATTQGPSRYLDLIVWHPKDGGL